MTTSISLPKEQRSAEERAKLRYPDHTEPDAMIGVRPWQLTRLAYAAAIAEEVEPLEAEVARLKALVGEAKGVIEVMLDDINPHTFPHRKWRDSVGIIRAKGVGSVTMPSQGPLMKAIELLTKLSKEGAADTLGVRAEDSAPGQTGVPSSLRSDPPSAAPNVPDAPAH